MSPHPGGTPKSITVDTTIAAGTVDDNAQALLLAAMSLEQGKTFNLNVFSTGEGTTKVVSVKVAAVENVAVPAGTVPAYRAPLGPREAPPGGECGSGRAARRGRRRR